MDNGLIKISATLLLLLGVMPLARAAACSNAASGNWRTAATWAAPCNVAGGPTVADDVTIINNTTVTVDAAGLNAKSVTIATGNRASTLTFAAGSSLAVANDVVINPANANNRTKAITVLTGALTVGGNVVLTGGGSATQDALLSVSTGNITINGGLSLNAATLNSATVQLTGAGTINVLGAAGVVNGDTVMVGTGTLNVSSGALSNNNAVSVSTGLLNVAGAYTNAVAGDTLTITGTGGRLTVGGTLTNAGSIIFNTAAGGIVNANGDFISSGSVTNTTAGVINVGGNFTNSGTFTAGTGTVTFNGTMPQTLTGATAFSNLTVNNAAGVVLASNITATSAAAGVVTLSSGIVTTGANMLTVPRSCSTPSVSRGTGYVNGNLQMAFPAVAGSKTCTFHVGDDVGYAPVTIALTTAGATGGTLAARVFNGDHPDTVANISAIDQTRSANRYWMLTPGTLATYTGYVPTLQFCAAACTNAERDANSTVGNFIVAKKNAGAWIRPAVAGTPVTSISTASIGSAQGFGEFAVGMPLSGVYKGVNQLIDLREVY